MEEIFDIVDEHDRVIGQAARSVVHSRRLLHRAVHILAFDAEGRLLLQLRSASKDEFPLCFTSSASGHLAAGETYDAAAARELEEELGVSGDLEFLTKLPASAETAYEFTAVYRTTIDGDDVRPHPGEIAGIEWASPEEVAERVKTEPARYSPPFRQIIEWLAREMPNP